MTGKPQIQGYSRALSEGRKVFLGAHPDGETVYFEFANPEFVMAGRVSNEAMQALVDLWQRYHKPGWGEATEAVFRYVLQAADGEGVWVKSDGSRTTPEELLAGKVPSPTPDERA